jgi:cellobiose-specific phosphotransferase system component IIC
METKDEAKDNILRGVSKKLRYRALKIAAVAVIACVLVGAFAYFMLFVRQTPMSATNFTDVRVDRTLQTINQVSDQALEYNQLKMNIANLEVMSAYAERQYYLEKNDDGETASIYFYMSQTHMQKAEAEGKSKEIQAELEGWGKENSKALVTPRAFHTDLEGALREITKVYYLVYDYANFSQQSFDSAKSGAVLLYEK